MFSWIGALEWIPRPLGYSSALTAFAGHLQAPRESSQHTHRLLRLAVGWDKFSRKWTLVPSIITIYARNEGDEISSKRIKELLSNFFIPLDVFINFFQSGYREFVEREIEANECRA